MTKIIFLVIVFLLISCDRILDYNYSENGKVSATIDDVQYHGSAYVSSKQLGDFVYESIVLIFDDSTNIEILSRRFEIGKFSCSPFASIVFTLTYNGKPFYSAKEGILTIKKVNIGQIIGEFDIVVFDATSSCANCPEDMMKTNGEFNAIKL